MFRLRLHPSPSNLAFGLALILFWALLWVWVFAQLPSAPSAVEGGIDRVVARIEVEDAQ